MEENKNPQTNETESFVKRYDTVFAFFGLELIALVTFGLGGASGLTFLKIIGFFISLASIPFIKAHHGELNFKNVLLCFIPLFVLAVLLGFSKFWFTAFASGSSTLSVIVENLTVTLGVSGFFLLAYGLKNVHAIKKEYILYALLGGLALYVLIAFLYSFIRYGFFYAAIYKTKNYYYDGILYPVAEEIKGLDGFAFKEVSMAYGCLPAFLLASVLPGALVINPNLDKKNFAIFTAFGLFGLVNLALVPFVKGLVLLAGVYIVSLVAALLRKAERNHPKFSKAMDTIWIIAVCSVGLIFAVFVGVLYIGANKNLGSPVLPNQYFIEIENTMFKSLHSYTGTSWVSSIRPFLFGQTLSEYSALADASTAQIARNRNFLFAILGQNGFIAFLLLVAIIGFCVYKARRYLLDEENVGEGRPIVATLGFALVAYLFFFYDETPFVHEPTSMQPFTRSIYVLLFAFIVGLIYSPKGLAETKEAAINE